MKKQHLFILIILMSLSLLGILSIQLVWIKNAMKIKEDQFDQHVFQAMNRAVFQLEKNETVSNINNSYRTSTFYYDNLDTTAQRQLIISDSLDGRLTISYNDSYQEKNSFYKENFSIDLELGFDNNQLGETISKDTIIDNKRYVWYFNGIDTTIMLVDADVKKTRQNTQNFNSAFDQMFSNLNSYNLPIDKRLEKGKFKETLSQELENFGIKTNFEYAVLNNRFFQSIPVRTGNFADDDFNTKFKIRLYPNDIFANNNILFIHFPKKAKHIFKSISLLLAFSVILTLIILATFTITIYIIQRQKKLSIIKSDFINNMTHEFKTPIATISLAADAINNDSIISDKNKVQHFVNVIKDENKRMNTQVENVLQMSLIDKEDFSFYLQEIDIHTNIEKAVQNISLQVEKKNGMIRTDFNANNPIIESDETHFLHIIYNLLDNANKYSPDKPEILVETNSDDNGVYINVSDKGIGMSKEQTSKIFEKFYRVSKGNIHDVKGFGLGLSYVKALILAFNGRIEVKSTPSKGSTFQIFLPYKNDIKK
jgi:two-component system, OmpR family, phosphate regulon sensor histidine kinase PhoR